MLSDELNINERVCVELWSQVTLLTARTMIYYGNMLLLMMTFCDVLPAGLMFCGRRRGVVGLYSIPAGVA